MPYLDPRGLARFESPARLSLRQAHRLSIGGGSLRRCTWLPASLQVIPW